MPSAAEYHPPLDELLPDPDTLRARIEALESEARDARAILRLVLRREQERAATPERREVPNAR
jgi:hypothetical protein